MKYLSVCDGIGAAHIWEEEIGWRCVGASEIAEFPKAVVHHNKPHIPSLGDMTKYHEWTIEHPDLICGGTPCQSFSVAGLRAGLADPRGNLALVFLGIVDHFRPTWVVWENVPGVYSAVSHEPADDVPPADPVEVERDGQEVDQVDEYDAEEQHAFACFLAGLQELGYGVFYRTLDAQYFGVPQRRRRPFVVGYLGDWRPPTAVLLEPEGMSGNPPPSRASGQRPTRTLAARAGGGGGLGTDLDLDGGLVEAAEVAHPILAKHNSSHAADQDTYVAHTLKGEAFDASDDGTGRGTPLVPEVSSPLTVGASRSGGGQPQAVMDQLYAVRRLTPTECSRLQAFPDDYLTLDRDADAEEARSRKVLRRMWSSLAQASNSLGEVGEQSSLLTPEILLTGVSLGWISWAVARWCVASGREVSGANAWPEEAVRIVRFHAECGSTPYRREPIEQLCRELERPLPELPYQRASWATDLLDAAVRQTPQGARVLRHALSAFQEVRDCRGKAVADGPRYKALGNSWCRNVALWIGRRIQLVTEIKEALPSSK